MKILYRFPVFFMEALKLNIFDINYIFFNPQSITRLLSADASGLPAKGIFIRIGVFCYHLLKTLKPSEWKKLRTIQSDSIVFLALTKNQKDSLEPIVRETENSIFVGNDVDYPLSLVMFISYLLAIPFFPLVLFKFLGSSGLRKTGFQHVFDNCWLMYGFYIAARIWIQKISPAVLIVSNDHNMEQRVLIKVAKAENIPTVYVQHASVTSEFPVLSFDYALLEGLDSLNTYDKIGMSHTKVFLIGTPKFDKYYKKVNRHLSVSSIGICTNTLSSMGRVEELCTMLRKNFPENKIILRPHPGDKRIAVWNKMAAKHGIELSKSKTEDAFSFLHNVDLVFAGNSSIHLEAVLMNVHPIFYDFSDIQRAITYSYLETGLCEYVSGTGTVYQKVKTLSKTKPDIRKRAEYYSASVHTQYDGYSSKLASSLLNEITQQDSVETENWRRIFASNLEAYEPDDDMN